MAGATRRMSCVATADTRFWEKTRDHPYLFDRVVHLADFEQTRPRFVK